MQKFKIGDKVIVIVGKDKGKIGNIKEINSSLNKVIVEGINLAIIHKKPTASSKGEKIKQEKYIDISNISHVEDGKPQKISFMLSEDDNGKIKKERVFKKSKNKVS